jgi:dinuclear metal center YbgI/SA1388 family protein
MRKTTRVGDVVAAMEAIAPAWMANPGDPVGLQAGDPKWPVRRILVALDLTAASLAAARRARCRMIVVHHPVFHSPVARMDESAPAAKLAGDLARLRMAVFTAHTNFDTVPDGINDILAKAAGIPEGRVLLQTATDPCLKLAVFVPEKRVAAVRQAVCGAGAGVIGEYSHCSFTLSGTGSFRGSAASNPAVGRPGRYEEVAEARLEVLLTHSIRDRVVQAMLAAHPYEEPAFDLYRLDDAKRYGCGRIGNLAGPLTVRDLARRMARFARSRCTQILGDPARRVRRVAVWSGGGCPVQLAIDAGAEAVVAGEIRHYDLLALEKAGVAAVLLGHGPSEAVGVRPLARMLARRLPAVEVREFLAPAPDLANL